MDIEMEKLLELKKLTLHHVLYEMQMYFFTLNYLCDADKLLKTEFENKEYTVMMMNNIIHESHSIHLRNLLYFFSDISNNNNDDFTCSMVVKEIGNLVICDNTDAKQAVNKSIAHLTKARFKTNLTEKTDKIIKEMAEIVPGKIQLFLDSLNSNIEEKYSRELKEEIIQWQIADIVLWLKIYN